jgi:hypothetical protein
MGCGRARRGGQQNGERRSGVGEVEGRRKGKGEKVATGWLEAVGCYAGFQHFKPQLLHECPFPQRAGRGDSARRLCGRCSRCRPTPSQITLLNASDEYARSVGLPPGTSSLQVSACLQVTAFLASGTKSERLPGESFEWVPATPRSLPLSHHPSPHTHTSPRSWAEWSGCQCLLLCRRVDTDTCFMWPCVVAFTRRPRCT